jgi:hypothetical protein
MYVPNLTNILKKLKKKVKEEIKKTSLGRVTKVNSDGTIDVAMLFGEEEFILHSVPVFILGSQSQIFRFEIKVGDMGLIQCLDYNFTKVWLSGQREERELNHHGLNAIFIPGFFKKGDEPQVGTDETLIGNLNSLISSTPSEIRLGNNANQNVVLNDDLVSVLNEVVSLLNTHVHGAAGTPPTLSYTGALQFGSSKTKAE